MLLNLDVKSIRQPLVPAMRLDGTRGFLLVLIRRKKGTRTSNFMITAPLRCSNHLSKPNPTGAAFKPDRIVWSHTVNIVGHIV